MVLTENKPKGKQQGFNSGLKQVKMGNFMDADLIKEGNNVYLKMGDYKTVVEELKKALGINNRNSFYAYRIGAIEPKVTQAEAVEGVFNRFGVTKNIWGA